MLQNCLLSRYLPHLFGGDLFQKAEPPNSCLVIKTLNIFSVRWKLLRATRNWYETYKVDLVKIIFSHTLDLIRSTKSRYYRKLWYMSVRHLHLFFIISLNISVPIELLIVEGLVMWWTFFTVTKLLETWKVCQVLISSNFLNRVHLELLPCNTLPRLSSRYRNSS